MLEKKYVKKIMVDSVAIPDQDAIARDIDWEFSDQFRKVRDLYPEGGYTIIYNGKKINK